MEANSRVMALGCHLPAAEARDAEESPSLWSIVPAALDLDAPTWVEWACYPLPIGQALYRMYAPKQTARAISRRAIRVLIRPHSVTTRHLLKGRSRCCTKSQRQPCTSTKPHFLHVHTVHLQNAAYAQRTLFSESAGMHKSEFAILRTRGPVLRLPGKRRHGLWSTNRSQCTFTSSETITPCWTRYPPSLLSTHLHRQQGRFGTRTARGKTPASHYTLWMYLCISVV